MDSDKKWPPVGHGRCSVFAGSAVAGIDRREMQKSLQKHLATLLEKQRSRGGLGKDRALGFPKIDHCHVSVLVAALTDKNMGFSLEAVHTAQQSPKLWGSADKTLLVIGETNFKFRPWKRRKNVICWGCEYCKEARFWGLEKIEGAHNDGVGHVVVIKEDNPHCSNLIDKNNRFFSPPAVRSFLMKKM